MYCTTYKISIENISDFSDNDIIIELLGGRNNRAVWRSHCEDMILLSSKFPGKVFTLKTQGENKRDRNEYVYCSGEKLSENLNMV